MAMGSAVGASAELLRFIRQGRSFSGHEPHCFFLNMGTGQFADLSASANLNLDDDGRAVGTVDWDFDGDVDLWITNRNGPQLRFLQNALPRRDRHYLSIRLQGESCNRDGIGARVTVESNSVTQTKTLRAGDGYLAQSSKWLHFGLGRSGEVSRVLVQWPGGERQQFTNVQPDHHYHLTQGRDAVEIDRAPIEIRRTDVSVRRDENSRIRVLSISDVPVPKLMYRTFDDDLQPAVPTSSQQVTLVNLFATWCQPCLQELSDLVRHASDIEAANLDVIALCVDPLDPNNSITKGQIQDVLERMGFSYRSGVATLQAVECLQLLNDHLFDLHLPLAVPQSVLIDREGKLVAFYKGPVETTQVLQDAAWAQRSLEERRTASTPFPGRWQEPLNRTSHAPLLGTLVQSNLLDEADDFVRRIGTARKKNLLPVIVQLGMAYYRNGNIQKSLEHLNVARRMEPSFVGVENALANQFLKENRPAEAAQMYRTALRRNPVSVVVLNNLAWLLATHPEDSLRNGNEAVRFAQTAVNLTQSKNAEILGTLAAAYAERGEFDAAVSTCDLAIAAAKAQGKIQSARKLHGQRELYESGKPYRQTTTQ